MVACMLASSPHAWDPIESSNASSCSKTSTVPHWHVVHCQELFKLIKKNSLEHVLLIVGGVIPYKDFAKLKEIGVDGVFPSNTTTQEIIQFLDQNLKEKNRQ